METVHILDSHRRVMMTVNFKGDDFLQLMRRGRIHIQGNIIFGESVFTMDAHNLEAFLSEAA